MNETSPESPQQATPAGNIDPDAALARIAQRIRRTPLMQCDALDAETGLQLTFKCEHLQHTGSFKFRGASHAVARLPSDCPGVVTHSSGNHGAALAAAARARGFSADIVMPENAVRSKIAAVRANGGTVHFCAPNQAAREAGLKALVELGRVAVPPYDHDDVIAGQGTLALEMMAQAPRLDCIVAPIGGGGLLSGITLAAARHAPGLQVIGAEPTGADDAARSLAAGQRVDRHTPDTIADGLRALIGVRNFAILQAHRVEILTVSEQQILEAMALLWRYLKQVIEPSGAVPLAAVLAHRERFRGRRVGIVLSGGNLDVEPLIQALGES